MRAAEDPASLRAVLLLRCSRGVQDSERVSGDRHGDRALPGQRNSSDHQWPPWRAGNSDCRILEPAGVVLGLEPVDVDGPGQWAVAAAAAQWLALSQA